jgi:hypothetical protein
MIEDRYVVLKIIIKGKININIVLFNLDKYITTIQNRSLQLFTLRGIKRSSYINEELLKYMKDA